MTKEKLIFFNFNVFLAKNSFIISSSIIGCMVLVLWIIMLKFVDCITL